MSKKLATILTAVFVTLSTAGFALAEGVSTTMVDFPFFQLGCLVIGGMIIISTKAKYDKMYTSEAMGAFALYTVLMSLFTSPVINLLKTIVS